MTVVGERDLPFEDVRAQGAEEAEEIEARLERTAQRQADRDGHHGELRPVARLLAQDHSTDEHGEQRRR